MARSSEAPHTGTMAADFCFPLRPSQRDLFDRIVRLLVLDPKPGRWGYQTLRGNWVTERSQELGDADILEHLAGTRWIGSRLPESQLPDRIIIDIDCKDGADLGSRDDRYQRVRRAFGEDWRPLVYGTPTGAGIRVAYRILPTPYQHLRGAVAALLAGQDLRVKDGSIEVYPAPNRLDRQMFGCSMPILCPDTLFPMIGDRGRPFDSEGGELAEAVRYCERWPAREHPGLVAMLRQCTATPPSSMIISHPNRRPPTARSRRRSGGTSAKSQDGHIRLLVVGLEAPSTRYDAEFVVGAALWRWPGQFRDLGLTERPTRYEVAHALALWLAQNHSGYSKEWSESVDRLGPARAVSWWCSRYLESGAAGGEAPIDRMARFARSLGGRIPASPHLTVAEHRVIQLLSLHLAGEFRSGMDRYQWEVWASHLVRVARSQVMRGGRSGDGTLAAAQIATEWMAGWPYGRHYRRYLALLLQDSPRAGSRPPDVEVLWTPRSPARQTATIYQVPWLDLRHDRPAGPDPQQVRDGIAGMTHHGRLLTVGEAYHAIDRVDRGGNLERIYGRGTADRVRRIAAAARNGGRVVF